MTQAAAEQQSGGEAGGAEAAPVAVLARKAARGRTDRPEPVPMTPQRALALALARIADQQMSLPLRVTEARAGSLSLAELPETITERSLIAVVEGPGEGLGIVALCPVMVSSLIEVQTVGRLSHRPVVPRRPTRTDAAMSAVFLDAVFEVFEGLLEGIEGMGWSAGYRYASFLDDPRPLGLMLEDCPYRSLTLEVTMGADAQRQGRVLMVLPASTQPASNPEAAHTPAARAAAEAATREAEAWAHDLAESVMGAELVLTGVLDRLQLPLSEVMALQPGQILPLNDDAISAISVEAVGAGGQALARARLGQNRGARALRLAVGQEGGGSPGDRAHDAGGASLAGNASAAALSPRSGSWAEEPAASPIQPPLPEAEAADDSPSELAPLPVSMAFGAESGADSAEGAVAMSSLDALADAPAQAPPEDADGDELAPIPMQIGSFG